MPLRRDERRADTFLTRIYVPVWLLVVAAAAAAIVVLLPSAVDASEVRKYIRKKALADHEHDSESFVLGNEEREWSGFHRP